MTGYQWINEALASRDAKKVEATIRYLCAIYQVGAESDAATRAKRLRNLGSRYELKLEQIEAILIDTELVGLLIKLGDRTDTEVSDALDELLLCQHSLLAAAALISGQPTEGIDFVGMDTHDRVQVIRRYHEVMAEDRLVYQPPVEQSSSVRRL